MKIAEVVMVMANTPKGLTNNRIAGKVITNKQKKDEKRMAHKFIYWSFNLCNTSKYRCAYHNIVINDILSY